MLPLVAIAVPAYCQDIGLQPTGCPTNPTQGGAPFVCVTTYMYSPLRAGLNLNEPTVTVSNVASGNFLLQFKQAVDDKIYAEPLYLPQVVLPGIGTYNVILVATENNSVYAFNADDNTGGANNDGVLWKTALPVSGAIPLDEMTGDNCVNISQTSPYNVGITGTPVIDISQNSAANTITKGTIYVVGASQAADGSAYYLQLFSVDVTTGNVFGSIEIDPASNFNPRLENQRGALLLQNSEVYVPFGSHCDNGGWAGWLVSYNLCNFTGCSFSEQNAWETAPDAVGGYNKGGIWQAGNGPAGDTGSRMFFGTANGAFNIKAGSSGTSCAPISGYGYDDCDYSDSIVSVDNTLKVQDFFSPSDQNVRTNHDFDLGSGGVLVVPNMEGNKGIGNQTTVSLLVQGGKEGDLFLADRTNLGGFETGNGGTDGVLGEILGNAQLNGGDPSKGLCFGYNSTSGNECGMWSSPAWWNLGNSLSSSNTTPYLSYVYVGPMGSGYTGTGDKKGEIIQYTLCPGPAIGNSVCSSASSGPQIVLSLSSGALVTTTDDALTFPGITPVITAASETSTSALLWALDNSEYPEGTNMNFAELFAYDAGSLGKSLWNSTGNNGQNNPGPAVKFTVPTVANGRVYVGGVGVLTVYGCRSGVC